MAVSCMRNASGHNYSSLVVDVAMDLAVGQLTRSTERISSCVIITSVEFYRKYTVCTLLRLYSSM